MDTTAKDQTDKALSLLKSNGDFAKTVETINKQSTEGKLSAGNSGSVDISSKFNGLRVSDISKLQSAAYPVLQGVLMTMVTI